MRLAHVLIAAVGVIFVAQAAPAAGTAYVVLSFIGNQLTIVTADIAIGSSMDKNHYQTLPLKSNDLDLAALRYADAAIRKAQPSAKITMMLPNDAAFYALKDSWLAANAIDGVALVARLKDQLGTDADTHIIVLLPYRAQPMLETTLGHIGTGKVAGLGFYVNNFQKTCKRGMAECDRGFLAPFVNFRMTLIDAATGAEESDEYTARGIMRSAAEAADRTAWNALPDDKKIALLQGILRQEISRLIPDLLARNHH